MSEPIRPDKKHSETPLSDALDLNALDSNDIRAWRNLARTLERRIAAIADFDAESVALSAGEGRSETELDLGPYDAISSLKGARYKLIMPSATPFVANVIAEVPDLNMARTIIERYNAHEKLLRRVATLILECAKAETEAETAGANSATTSLTDVELGEIIYSRVSGPTQLRNAIAKAIVHDIRTADRKAT